MSARNPRRVADAMAPVGTQPQGCDVRLGEFTAGTVLLLQQLGHPLIESGDGKAARSKTGSKAGATAGMTDVQLMQLVFVLATPAASVFDLLAEGRTAFDREVFRFAGTLPIGALPELGAKVAEAFSRAVSTVMPAASGSEKKTRSTP